MDFDGRKIVFKALVGSHNYNLNDETSDEDYKYFVLPTFDDLYDGNIFSYSSIGQYVDYDVHDIRKLTNLFWKANINFLEVLYSKEMERQLEIVPVYEQCHFEAINKLSEIDEIIGMRDKIVKMNLPYLYSACKGMYFEKMKRLEKGTEGTQYLVEKYGYDTKQALHAYRVLNFIVRFAEHSWCFRSALTYNKEDREDMLAIKNGYFNLSEFKSWINDYIPVFNRYEDLYKSMEPDLETKAKLESLIKELVRRNIR